MIKDGREKIFMVLLPVSCNYRPQTYFAKVMFLHVSVILSTGGGACVVAPGGRGAACVVALGGMHGCSGGVCGCSGGHAWLRGGHAWLLPGGHAWLLLGGACMVAPGGCMGYDEIRRYDQ